MANDLQPTFATLGGLPVSGMEPVGWELREGAEPVTRDFLMTQDHALQLRERVGAIRLSLGIRDTQFNFDNLYVLDLPPGPSPHLRYVRVADRRWIWKYVHVLRRFNMRRKVGVKRPNAPGGDLVIDVDEDISYAEYSLNPDNFEPWTANEIIDNVLERVLSRESEFAGAAPAVFERANATDDEIPIENLELDDRGDMAISRCLQFIPGLALFIDQSGNVVLYNKADGTEAALVSSSKEIVERGHLELVDKRVIRPQSVRVHFTMEQEVRFDYAELTEDEDG